MHAGHDTLLRINVGEQLPYRKPRTLLSEPNEVLERRQEQV
jgi:hypothetical protein